MKAVPGLCTIVAKNWERERKASTPTVVEQEPSYLVIWNFGPYTLYKVVVITAVKVTTSGLLFSHGAGNS